MFIPPYFAESDPQKLAEFVSRHGFGLLVSAVDGELFASHIPMLLDQSANVLRGHVARANPQWRGLDGRQVLAVFSGPHAYVSPTWYQSENVVPTWNYIAVHVYGTFRVIDGPDAMQLLTDLVTTYESGFPTPWSFDPSGDYARKHAAAIVAFRVEIDRIEGKWKLNQNHPAERRERVAQNLLVSSDTSEQEIGRLMAEQLSSKPRA